MVPQPARTKTYTRQTQNAGIGVFASEDIGPGELVLHIPRPLVSALDTPHLTDTCYSCYLWLPGNKVDEELEDDGAHQVSLKTCTGCKVVRYCSKVGLIGWHFFYGLRGSRLRSVLGGCAIFLSL